MFHISLDRFSVEVAVVVGRDWCKFQLAKTFSAYFWNIVCIFFSTRPYFTWQNYAQQIFRFFLHISTTRLLHRVAGFWWRRCFHQNFKNIFKYFQNQAGAPHCRFLPEKTFSSSTRSRLGSGRSWKQNKHWWLLIINIFTLSLQTLFFYLISYFS